jgi:hypothetical protein
MIRQDSLRALSLICLLSWACLTGILVDEGSPAWSGGTIVMVGCVKEVFTEPAPSSISMTSIFDSQEWSFVIPADMVIPGVGRMIVISCHATDSGLVIYDLHIL